jgi:hypothetical protein
MSIYVEIDIDATMEELWARTQTPELHERWDLRFTEIEYLPRPDESRPQRFLYATRIGFGLGIAGEGETVGSRNGDDGSRTSALTFWSDDRASLIRVGSGYWKYIPTSKGVRFLTWYDYSTRFGMLGRAIDAVIFRPLMGRATAWSFDRLRLWLEKGIDPQSSMRLSLAHAISRIAIAAVWIYHGLVPKLLERRPEELSMLVASGAPEDLSQSMLTLVGLAEIALGLLFIVAWRARWLFIANIVLMIASFSVVAIVSSQSLVAAFNPVTLNGLMIAVSGIGYITGRDIPTAANCRRRKREEEE